MITSFEWVLVALLFDPALGVVTEYAILDYYKTQKECLIEKNAQPHLLNVGYYCVRRGG